MAVRTSNDSNARRRRHAPAARQRTSQSANKAATRKPRWGADRMERLVPPASRHRGAIVPWRSVPIPARSEVVDETVDFVLRNLGQLKHIPPSGREYATLLKLTFAVGMGESTARGLFASKKAMVALARGRRQKMKSRRSQEYLKWCADNGRAPGSLAGVDFRNW